MNADNVQGAETVGEQKAGNEPEGAPVEQASEGPALAEAAAGPAEAAAGPAEAAPPFDLPEPSIHETLLEGVSANALAVVGAGEAGAESVAAAPAEPETAEFSKSETTDEPPAAETPEVETPEPLTVASETGAPEIGEPEAVASEPEPAPLAEDLTVVAAAEPALVVETASTFVETIAHTLPESLAAALPETVVEFPEPAASLSEAVAGISGAAGGIPEAATSMAQAAVASLPVAWPEGRTLLDLAKAPPLAGLMGELGEVNATVLTYLRGEGTAALAHWQALSGARTPADALRIQVDEMQRAADASLTCFSTLAQRAGRFGATLGRS